MDFLQSKIMLESVGYGVRSGYWQPLVKNCNWFFRFLGDTDLEILGGFKAPKISKLQDIFLKSVFKVA